MTKFFDQTLNDNEKILLLRAFTFSTPFLLGNDPPRPRHLMYEEYKQDSKFKTKHYIEEDPSDCTESASNAPLCYCERWLRERGMGKLRDFFHTLIEKLYEMRSAIVHDAFPVLFFFHHNEQTEEFASVSLADIYTHKKKYISYNAGLSYSEFEKLIKKAFLTFFEQGCTLK